jgi:RecA-family ATPase
MSALHPELIVARRNVALASDKLRALQDEALRLSVFVIPLPDRVDALVDIARANGLFDTFRCDDIEHVIGQGSRGIAALPRILNASFNNLPADLQSGEGRRQLPQRTEGKSLIVADTAARAARGHSWPCNGGIAPDTTAPAAPGTAGKGIQWLDMSNWDREPIPERKWAILNRVPVNQAGLFSGEGGTGKTILELMKDVAHVAGKDWLGSLPEPGPAIYIGAEDEEDELHRRLAAIAAHYGVTFEELIAGGLHVLCLLGQDATVCAVSRKSGRVEVTDLYRQLYEAAGDIKPRNISIDTLSRAFAGNEIDRVQVYAFAMHMQALAMVAGGSATILSHPSLQGIASGTGLSGSTAWHGAFRFRQYLKGVRPADGEQSDNNLRELEFKKNQYGPTCEAIALRYQHGLFLPLPGPSSLDQAAREAQAEGIFLELLRSFNAQNRHVSDKTSSAYAPAVFAKEAAAKAAGLGNVQLASAMRRLFAADKIWNEPCGKPSRPQYRIALKP